MKPFWIVEDNRYDKPPSVAMLIDGIIASRLPPCNYG